MHTTAKAAVGEENQLTVVSMKPSLMKTQFISPNEESNIQAKMTTAITSGTAQGRATRSLAKLRPLNLLLTRRAVARPITKQNRLTMTTSFSVTQLAFQKSPDANNRS